MAILLKKDCIGAVSTKLKHVNILATFVLVVKIKKYLAAVNYEMYASQPIVILSGAKNPLNEIGKGSFATLKMTKSEFRNSQLAGTDTY